MAVEEAKQDADGALLETRCYTITGTAGVLDGLEALLRRVEWVSEEKATRLVSAFVDGRAGAVLSIRVLASWVAEAGEGEWGALLPRLEDERAICACYVTEII